MSLVKQLLLALAVLAVVLFIAKPASPWEFDEFLFFQSLHHFDPLAHHPPPPGYPVFAGVGHMVRMLLPGDFAALVTISIIGSLIAFALFALAFARMSGDLTAGVAAALLFYFSPALLVHSTLPMSEPGALALLAAGMWLLCGRSVAGGAAFLALTAGWRPQFAIFVVPFLLTAVVMMRNWRDRAIAVAVFTIVCVAWLVPLASSAGGVERLIHFEAGQATYVSAHDADVSRSGWTAPQLASRFIAHPWGTKVESLPLLAVALIGMVLMRRERRLIPLAVASVVYLAFALAVMDPADGVRYAIPFVLGISLFAGVGAVWIARMVRAPAYTIVAMFAIASMIYVSSLISQRRRMWSPPAEAAAVARRAFPPNAVPLYELPLWPHAEYYFSDRHPMRVNDGLAKYFDRPDVPLFLYADGMSHAPGARVFRWMPSDAYSKLTRNHYRIVSLVPLPPGQRFRVIRGVYAPEREIDGDEWRWLGSPAELQLPHGPARTLVLKIGLPALDPMERNTVSIRVNDGAPRLVALERGKAAVIEIVVPPGAPVIHFEAQQTFVPASVPGSLNRDSRRLALQLYDLHTR